MTSPGKLLVSARFVAGGLQDLRVDLRRPSVTRLFIDQLPEVVTKTVPYLFTLCAHAQRAAAQAALAAAEGREARAADSAELWIEVLHENLWRLLLDWPPALGIAPEKDAFIAWRGSRHSENSLAVTQRLLADTLRPLAEKCLKKLVDRGLPENRRAADESAVPALAPAEWLAYWQGMASAMPVLPAPHSIRALFLARVAEVEAAVEALAAATPFPVVTAGGSGWGVAQLATARGVLTHAAQVIDGKVADYRVQAPTDRFFADAGTLSSLLSDCEFSTLNQARQTLNQAILALDPCLPYEVELQDA